MGEKGSAICIDIITTNTHPEKKETKLTHKFVFLRSYTAALIWILSVQVKAEQSLPLHAFHASHKGFKKSQICGAQAFFNTFAPTWLPIDQWHRLTTKCDVQKACVFSLVMLLWRKQHTHVSGIRSFILHQQKVIHASESDFVEHTIFWMNVFFFDQVFFPTSWCYWIGVITPI